MTTVTGNLQQEYADAILSGLKTKEIRLNEGKWSDVEVGDTLSFNNGAVKALVTAREEFDTFREALSVPGALARALPGVATISEGVEVYWGIPNYKKKESNVGVVVFDIVLTA